MTLCIPIGWVDLRLDSLLPCPDSGKKIVLSDLEKQRRKEENARRRKLQMDQKMENDRVRLSLATDQLVQVRSHYFVTAERRDQQATKSSDRQNTAKRRAKRRNAHVRSRRGGRNEWRRRIRQCKKRTSHSGDVAVRFEHQVGQV